jgi:hypothetical protein
MRDRRAARRRVDTAAGSRVAARASEGGRVKLAPLLAGEMVKERIACDVRGYALVVCQVESDAGGRVLQLWQRLREHLGESPRELPRAAVLRALLIRGFEAAEHRGVPVPIRQPRLIVRYECLITGLEFDRLVRFRRARWASGFRPPIERLLGALVRCALPLAELDARFAVDVLCSRLPRAKGRP